VQRNIDVVLPSWCFQVCGQRNIDVVLPSWCFQVCGNGTLMWCFQVGASKCDSYLNNNEQQTPNFEASRKRTGKGVTGNDVWMGWCGARLSAILAHLWPGNAQRHFQLKDGGQKRKIKRTALSAIFCNTPKDLANTTAT
jgi:hypothetical protein